MSIIIPDEATTMMLRDATSAYPEECCGVLLGHATTTERVVVRVLSIVNERDSERRTRYLIGPDEYRAADRLARASGLDVIGVYHSHPDHPAVPSSFDREHAWPWFAYIIVPVQAGRAGIMRAWQLREDRSAFDELKIAHADVAPIVPEEAK